MFFRAPASCRGDGRVILRARISYAVASRSMAKAGVHSETLTTTERNPSWATRAARKTKRKRRNRRTPKRPKPRRRNGIRRRFATGRARNGAGSMLLRTLVYWPHHGSRRHRRVQSWLVPGWEGPGAGVRGRTTGFSRAAMTYARKMAEIGSFRQRRISQGWTGSFRGRFRVLSGLPVLGLSSSRVACPNLLNRRPYSDTLNRSPSCGCDRSGAERRELSGWSRNSDRGEVNSSIRSTALSCERCDQAVRLRVSG